MEKIAIYVLSFVLPLAATLILFGIVKSSGQVDGTVPSGFLSCLFHKYDDVLIESAVYGKILVCHGRARTPSS